MRLDERSIRTLGDVTPTAEQLRIFSRTRPGVELIRGAAGSGKTTTALLKLRALIGFYVSRRRRTGSADPIRVLVLTYNRTLKGYVRELAFNQITASDPVLLEVETFARWAHHRLGMPKLVSGDGTGRHRLLAFASDLNLDGDFLADEVDYVTGRFTTTELDKYIASRREGRGSSPRVERALRQQILNDVIRPFDSWKRANGELTWNDLALELATKQTNPLYDIIIADETQDFSANQIRAVMNQVKIDHSVTFVLDSAQRIYPRGFTWAETGLQITGDASKRLSKNYRNTVEIAAAAASLVSGISIDDDGTIPTPGSCVRHGDKPKMLKGRFSAQIKAAIAHVKNKVDLTQESVAFLHPKGWFDHVRSGLAAEGLEFVELTRQSEWPAGDVNIGLCTLHSAKGLEFDHVIIIGLNAETTKHGDEEDDDSLSTLRRLLAMGIGRARRSVLLGYKPDQESKLISYMDPETFSEVLL